MTRNELIEGIIERLLEGPKRRAAAAAFGPHALAGKIGGGWAGVATGAAVDYGAGDAITIGQHVGSLTGHAAGGVAGHALLNKDLQKMEKSKNRGLAARKFSAKHPTTAKFVLPKNKAAARKLARRGTVGHVAHGAMRSLLGAGNVGRYATKVSYARSGYHRGEK